MSRSVPCVVCGGGLGCEFCPALTTEEVARVAAAKVARHGGSLDVLNARELSALAAVLLARLDGEGRVAA